MKETETSSSLDRRTRRTAIYGTSALLPSCFPAPSRSFSDRFPCVCDLVSSAFPTFLTMMRPRPDHVFNEQSRAIGSTLRGLCRSTLSSVVCTVALWPLPVPSPDRLLVMSATPVFLCGRAGKSEADVLACVVRIVVVCTWKKNKFCDRLVASIQ